MSSSAARKARIGEVPQAEGFGKKQRCSFAAFLSPDLQKSRFAADGQPLRLAGEPLPLYRRCCGGTGEDICSSGPSFFVENNPDGLCWAPLPAHGARTPPIASQQRETLLCFKFLTKECSCIDHGKTCYIAGGAATQRKTFAGSGRWLSTLCVSVLDVANHILFGNIL